MGQLRAVDGRDRVHDRGVARRAPEAVELGVRARRQQVPRRHPAPPARAVGGSHRTRPRQQVPLPRNLPDGGTRGARVRRRGQEVPRAQGGDQLRATTRDGG